MQVQFNTDKTVEGHQRMQHHFSEVIAESFKRFEDKITRVEVHLGDENNEKFGVDDKRCMIEVRLSGKNPLAVTNHANTVEKSISGAIDKMKKVLTTTFEKLKMHS
ncbi:HPF/RaiA family ribosome-associated protein [Flavobacterium sp.]|uniref:HPF/RaiA family ribosome-associated protein n=1 Tax=Flavobacterium sp. TaxID=239 RepID=UPI00262B2928|nr:HPF/RaiA family ribosome-associated protein [Flavobacterium sp.]MDD3004885.1 HPF/RaiA family ribosome-associated protein [Flavobacterium sp.]